MLVQCASCNETFWAWDAMTPCELCGSTDKKGGSNNKKREEKDV